MVIDNSSAKMWLRCAAEFQERQIYQIEPKGKSQALGFGTRMHQLLEQRHKLLLGVDIPEFPALSDGELEDEAQEMFAQYEAAYPLEPFEVISVEQYFEVPLPGSTHVYHGEFDGVVRNGDEAGGRYFLLETKTEQRNGKGNLPEAWANRSQVGLYLWAAEQLYGETFGGILLNVLTRRSPAGKFGATFRRDRLERTEWQKREAVGNITWVADQIERMQGEYEGKRWPQNRENCHNGFFKCSYADLHATEERSEELVQIKFQPAEKYLAL